MDDGIDMKGVDIFSEAHGVSMSIHSDEANMSEADIGVGRVLLPVRDRGMSDEVSLTNIVTFTVSVRM